jgi:transcriptional antiterminator RfaH
MLNEWYALQFKLNSHNVAVKNLNRQGFETFLPLYNITSRKASRFMNSVRPLFPGYMFINFNKADTKWHKINNTHGVSRLVTFNSILKPIPTIFVDNLMMRYDRLGNLLPVDKLKKDDRVKVLKGPFANFIATVETYKTEDRIWVLMDLMGRQTKIKTHTENLQLSN